MNNQRSNERVGRDEQLRKLGIVRESWCSGDSYTGTRDALIRAGLAATGEFPGSPGRNKTSVTIRAPEYRQITVSSTRRGSILFSVRVRLPPDEAEEREQRRARDSRLAQERSKHERFIATWPKSADEYRKRLVYETEHLAWLLGAGAGYEFDVATVETVREAIAEIQDALAEGRVEYDARWRPRAMQKLRSMLAADDGDFQAFIATATASTAKQQ